MGLEHFEKCVECFNRELQQEGRLIVPERHPLKREQARFSAVLRRILSDWPAEILKDEEILAAGQELGVGREDMPTEDQLLAILRESLHVRWPSVSVQVSTGPYRDAVMEFGMLFPNHDEHAVLQVRDGSVRKRPFWMGETFVKLIKGCNGDVWALAEFLFRVFDQFTTFVDVSEQEHEALLALVLARVVHARPVSALEIAAIQQKKKALDLYNAAADLTPLQSSLDGLVKKVLARKVVAVQPATLAGQGALLQLKQSANGFLPSIPLMPQTGVWDTCERWLVVPGSRRKKGF